MRVASLGEAGAAARLMAIWLQGFDTRGGNLLPYQRLDYSRLIAWLDAILELDPRGGYPLFAAARVAFSGSARSSTHQSWLRP